LKAEKPLKSGWQNFRRRRFVPDDAEAPEKQWKFSPPAAKSHPLSRFCRNFCAREGEKQHPAMKRNRSRPRLEPERVFWRLIWGKTLRFSWRRLPAAAAELH